MNQTEMILQYMREHGSISQREAVKLGCYRLSARIHDLRRCGYVIRATQRNFIGQTGRTGYYAEYTLVE